MTLPAISHETGVKIGRIGEMMNSIYDPEALTASRKFVAAVHACGWRITDLVNAAIAPHGSAHHHRPADHRRQRTPAWRVNITRCMSQPDLLTDWEAQFLASIARRSSLTPKQAARLADIVAKIGGAA